jgi:hypothetical protein
LLRHAGRGLREQIEAAVRCRREASRDLASLTKLISECYQRARLCSAGDVVDALGGEEPRGGRTDQLQEERMSQPIKSSRLTVPEIRGRKGKEKIVCQTACSAPLAAILEPLVDLMLVGDSLGMVVHGLPTTSAPLSI